MAGKPQTMSLPSPTYKIESSDRELRMSYGMFNDIMRIIGHSEDLSIVLITDPMVRDLVIRRLFTDTKQSVNKEEDLINAFDIEVLPSELDGVLSWVADHASHFMLSTGRAMRGILEKYQDQIPQPDPVPENQSSPSLSNGSTS